MDNPRSSQQQAAQARPCCSPDNNHGCQRVVGRILILTARPARLWTSSRAFRQASPSENTSAPKSRVRTAAIQITGTSSCNDTTGAGRSVPATQRVFQDRRTGSARVSTTSGSPFSAAPNGSRHGMLLRLGVRDINRICLLWKEEDIAKVGGQRVLGSLTPSFHFVSLKPRHVATDL